MLKNLPQSLLRTAQKIVENTDILESCVSCGAVFGCCIHTDNLAEDNLTSPVPVIDAPEEQLSGEKEDVIINPAYKTFVPRRPF